MFFRHATNGLVVTLISWSVVAICARVLSRIAFRCFIYIICVCSEYSLNGV